MRLLPTVLASLALLLATSLPAFADASPTVGDPGPRAVSLESLSLAIGPTFSVTQDTPSTVGSAIDVDGYGTFSWPQASLTQQETVPVADQSYDIGGGVATATLTGASVSFTLTADSDADATVNPATGAAALVVSGTVTATATGHVDGSVLGSPISTDASCSIPDTPVSLTLATANAGGVAYDPATGSFTATDVTFAIPATPTCNFTNPLYQSLADLIGPFLVGQFGLPATAGQSSMSVSGKLSPAAHAPLAPFFSSAPHVTGVAAEGHLLTCASAVGGVPTPVRTYEWLRGASRIAGATGSTHRVTAADAGHSLRCGVGMAASPLFAAVSPALSSPSAAVPPRCHVPHVVGLGLSKAKSQLRRHGCTVGRVTRRASRTRAGTVLASSPRGGAVRPGRTPVRLTVAGRAHASSPVTLG